MELFSEFSVANLMLLGSMLGFGVATFLLARTLFPDRLVQQVRERRQSSEEAGLNRPGGRMRAVGAAIVETLGDHNAALVARRPKFAERMRLRFVALGRPEMRPEDFVAHQWVWAAFFSLLGLGLMNLMHRPLIFTLPFTLFGALFPYIWLADQIKKRQRQIRRELPYNLDLLTLSVEAGLDFQAALATVVDKGRAGPLSEELSVMLGEIKLGTTRADALRNMAARVQMPEMSAFVSNLVQADRMGTSLGKVLRIQSNQMRINRTQRAEKLANEAPVKLLLPLLGCIFPTVFLVLFGPIVYRLLVGGGV